MPTLRCFLAHPKAISDEDIERLKLMATALAENEVRKAGGARRIEVVTGRDDFAARAVEAGGWEAWCASVGKGTAWRDGTLQPLFDVIIVTPRRTFGKATAQILHAAFGVRKPVFVLVDEEEPKLVSVQGVFVGDRKDFQNGFYAE